MVSGDPVQPNQREHVELEIVDQSPEQTIVANDDQVQHGSSSTEAPASNVNVVYQEGSQTAGDNISLADTEYRTIPGQFGRLESIEELGNSS